MLCRSCAGKCADLPTDDSPALLECPLCGGVGCESCDEGFFTLTQCPRKYVTQDIVAAVNLAGIASKGTLPVAGGVLDQSAWFVDLWQTLECDTNAIDAERMKDG